MKRGGGVGWGESDVAGCVGGGGGGKAGVIGDEVHCWGRMKVGEAHC